VNFLFRELLRHSQLVNLRFARARDFHHVQKNLLRFVNINIFLRFAKPLSRIHDLRGATYASLPSGKRGWRGFREPSIYRPIRP
jgi:hypothetical protein